MRDLFERYASQIGGRKQHGIILFPSANIYNRQMCNCLPQLFSFTDRDCSGVTSLDTADSAVLWRLILVHIGTSSRKVCRHDFIAIRTSRSFGDELLRQWRKEHRIGDCSKESL